MIMVEYGAGVAGFIFGWKQLFVPDMVFLALFLVWFACVELALYMRFRPCEFHEAKLRRLGPICVESLQIPLWLFYYIVFLPNYVDVVSTSYTAGSSYLSQSESSKALFQRNWSYIPFVGGIVGGLGIPKILTLLLMFSCAFHLMCALVFSGYLWGEALPERCDSGNLLSELVASDSRLFICFFIKYPFLWMKTSLLAMQYDSMTWDMLAATLLSIALAWYGVLQLIPCFVRMAESVIGVRCQFMTVLVPLVMLCLGLTQQAIHLFGVFACSTHDLSMFKGGC